MYFFHKKIVILIIFSAIIICGAFVLAEFKNKKSEKVVYTSPQMLTADTLSSDLQDLDADKDELKDWEEVLLGTDPDKSDTDGDGTSDGKEAASGRNPLVAGPNDKAETAKTNEPAKPLTPSEKIARNFFARYMELRQIGLEGDAQSQQELIEEVIANGIVLEKPKNFVIADVKTTSDNSIETIRNYGNTVGNIFKSHPHPGRDEAVIANESIEKEEPTILKEIDPIIANYRAIRAELLAVKVPSSMAEMHLNLVNAINKFVFVSESLRKFDVDTMKGIQGTAGYLDAGNSLFSSLKTLVNYFDLQKIIYGPNEGGSMFTKK